MNLEQRSREVRKCTKIRRIYIFNSVSKNVIKTIIKKAFWCKSDHFVYFYILYLLNVISCKWGIGLLTLRPCYWWILYLVLQTESDKHITEQLLEGMLNKFKKQRPKAEDVLISPFFWSRTKQLNFIVVIYYQYLELHVISYIISFGNITLQNCHFFNF